MRKGLTGRDVFLMMLAFFGVVIGVNVLMVTYAVETFSGEDAQHPYLQGLHFNKTLAERHAQNDAGWEAKMDVTPDAAGQTVIVMELFDRNKAPVTGVVLEGDLRLPATSREDRDLRFQETAPGRYEVATSKLHEAYWGLLVNGTKDGAPVFEARNRIWIR